MLQQIRKRYSRGSSMVEMALVVVLFLGLVFAIIEFSLALFYANRLIEATRAGARYAVVSNPLDAEFATYDCAAPLQGTVTVSSTACDGILGSSESASYEKSQCGLGAAMNALVDIPYDHITYRYDCTSVGTDQVNRVYTVRIGVEVMTYKPILPNLFILNGNGSSSGSDFSIAMPSFETTRTSEDQFGH